MSATYSFIENVNDFFSTGYFTDDFAKKVFDRSGHSAEGIKQLSARFSLLRQHYNRYKQDLTSRYARTEDRAGFTHDFNTRLLTCLAYADAANPQPDATLSLPLGQDGKALEVPVRTVCCRADGSPQLYVMDVETLISADSSAEAATGFVELGLDRMATHIFALPEHEHPRYLLLLGGNKVFFLDADKWERGAYLSFDIERLLVETTQAAMRNYFALFYLLISHDALAATSDTPLMQQLEEESYKNAYAVTQDLKRGVVNAVEALANEAIWFIKKTPSHKYHTQDETDDDFESLMRDDCLVYIYRLLFIFYAESRPDLDILPVNDQTYLRGYSLEMLRDLEQVNLISEEERGGYFFDRSIKQLFALILRGHNEDRKDADSLTASFRVRHIDSPLFSDQKLKVLQGVCFRNSVWQGIICELSLSQRQKGKARGRISYANLGINQLGSVYENLLAYRGFFAEEDYIEVHKKADDRDTYLVPRSRRDDFSEDEILKDADGRDVLHPKGDFIYRLNGRDRRKSASYYTPEVLTKSTVKYTLRGFVEKLESGAMKACDLLRLKILEPAMGAAAFQNEVINQLAVLYLNYRRREVGRAIDPLLYPEELQKVKAFIATNNVYGVDLNATAIELGKLSLWLNVMHRDMEVPFFSNRIAQGNAVIGAWLKVYKQADVVRTVDKYRKVTDREWWTAPTRRISFTASRPDRHSSEVYHFLLPVKEMLGVLDTKQRGKADPAFKRMTELRADWLRGISSEEYEQLRRISRKVDALLKQYVEFQMSVEKNVNNGYRVWEFDGQLILPFNTNAARQEFDDLRYRRNSPYMKLKMAMDYWCALFFWEFADAKDLPKRQEFWDDVERLLDVNLPDEVTYRFRKETLFGPEQGEFVFNELEHESAVKAKAMSQVLAEAGGRQTGNLQLGDDALSNNRFAIVARLANRYHFFHPMLDFLEVFWLRDGFDIICGNPPWIKLQFIEQDVVSDKYPEVAIRKVSAPDVRKILDNLLKNEAMRQFYTSEQNEYVGSTAFLNAQCNYPLLAGQQTNLYKCVLSNCLDLASPSQGFIGLLTQNGIYDDAKGQAFRRELYKRLRFHFQYQNELRLFAEVGHHKIYECQLLGPCRNSSPDFFCIHNLFHPSTVDACFAHDGHGHCGGIKDDAGNWNTQPHRDRIVHFTGREIALLSNTFEDGTTQDCARLVRIHCQEIISVLEKLSDYPTHVRDKKSIITMCIHETNGVDDGIMHRETRKPVVEKYETILGGIHFIVANPCGKNPRKKCTKTSDYDIVDLTSIPADFSARVNYVPAMPLEQYKQISNFQGFVTGKDKDGNPTYGQWLDYYKVAFRSMLDPTQERTLICAVLHSKTAHINGVTSISFLDGRDTVDMAALCQSLVLDFYLKSIGSLNLSTKRLDSFPLGVPPRYQTALYVRALLLNCLTCHYADLWRDTWRSAYATEVWSQEEDHRLKPFCGLTQEWSWQTPLRNYYERRMALVEIDVLAAMALGLSLEDLLTIYTIQFPVLQQNEQDTWYDASGNIVFTTSRGLTGVGCDRKQWEQIRGDLSPDRMTYAGTAPTYVLTVDPKRSELYAGQQVTYTAPYTRCDRLADYRRAWQHFSQRLGGE